MTTVLWAHFNFTQTIQNKGDQSQKAVSLFPDVFLWVWIKEDQSKWKNKIVWSTQPVTFSLLQA